MNRSGHTRPMWLHATRSGMSPCCTKSGPTRPCAATSTADRHLVLKNERNQPFRPNEQVQFARNKTSLRRESGSARACDVSLSGDRQGVSKSSPRSISTSYGTRSSPTSRHRASRTRPRRSCRPPAGRTPRRAAPASSARLPAGEQERDGLCYDKCRSGYTDAVTMCVPSCPDGFKDIGLFCSKPDRSSAPSIRGSSTMHSILMARCGGAAADHGDNCEKVGEIIYSSCPPTTRPHR